MRKLKIFYLSLILMSLISCATQPKTLFTAGDLCGLIVDEENHPVAEYVVTIANHSHMETYITNENGVFYASNLETGLFWMDGQKEGFTKLKNVEIPFYEIQKIYCWQIKSEKAVLNDVEKLVKSKQYKKALDSLEDVECSNNPENRKANRDLLNSLHEMIKKEKKESKKNEE